MPDEYGATTADDLNSGSRHNDSYPTNEASASHPERTIIIVFTKRRERKEAKERERREAEHHDWLAEERAANPERLTTSNESKLLSEKVVVEVEWDLGPYDGLRAEFPSPDHPRALPFVTIDDEDYWLTQGVVMSFTEHGLAGPLRVTNRKTREEPGYITARISKGRVKCRIRYGGKNIGSMARRVLDEQNDKES